MTKWFLTAALFFASYSGAWSADWRDELTTQMGSFPPMRPLTAHYEFGWSGLTAAAAVANFSIKGSQNELQLDVSTINAASKMWQMKTRAVSLCDSLTLKPVSLRQTETYSDGSIVTKVDFLPKYLERLKVANPPDKEPPKLKKFKFAEVHEMQSALLFLRSQPLNNGDVIKLCVYPASSPYLAEIRVQHRERIKIGAKEWNTIRCTLSLRQIDKKFKLKPHDKFKNAIAWISDDDDRLLLKIEAEVFIGKVWLELKSLEFPPQK